MNLIDCTVVKILGEPKEKYGKFWVSVEYEAYGRTSVTEIMCENYHEAEMITIGSQFLS